MDIWVITYDFVTCRIVEQQKFRRVCAIAMRRLTRAFVARIRIHKIYM